MPCRQRVRRRKIPPDGQHSFKVVKHCHHGRFIVDGVQPDRFPAKENEDDVGQWARAQAAGDCQVHAQPQPTPFPLTLVGVERYGWNPPLRLSAAAALADEKLPLDDAQFLDDAIGARHIKKTVWRPGFHFGSHLELKGHTAAAHDARRQPAVSGEVTPVEQVFDLPVEAQCPVITNRKGVAAHDIGLDIARHFKRP